MKQLIPVANNTKMPIYVGGRMIPPGETYHFDIDQVPANLRPQAAQLEPEVPADPLAELLQQRVSYVATALPDLSDEDLTRLGDLEQTGAARKGVLGAIAEELLKRAEAKAGSQTGGESDPDAGGESDPGTGQQSQGEGE